MGCSFVFMLINVNTCTIVRVKNILYICGVIDIDNCLY